jgi:hypothetical protein
MHKSAPEIVWKHSVFIIICVFYSGYAIFFVILIYLYREVNFIFKCFQNSDKNWVYFIYLIFIYLFEVSDIFLLNIQWKKNYKPDNLKWHLNSKWRKACSVCQHIVHWKKEVANIPNYAMKLLFLYKKCC